jgi:hypothetical protein
MTRTPGRLCLIAFLLALCPLSAGAGHRDRRVVDSVLAGDPISEAGHGYVGSDAVSGVAGGQAFRQARGWIRYALTTFDDTEVTLVCAFVRTDAVTHGYDVVVEDSLIATRALSAQPDAPAVVAIAVPLSVTKGKTSVAVVIRARGGLTPALREIRTVQDHNELE